MQAKGSNGLLAIQYEGTFNVDPDTPNTTKVYFESEGFKGSRNLISSSVMTGSRQPSAPIAGNIDTSGSISTELQAYHAELLVGAAGSVKTEANSGTGEVLGSALAYTSATINSASQILLVNAPAHGLVPGDVVFIAGLTSPTALNNTYCRVIKPTLTDIFYLRIPKGISETFTIGSGTFKKVTTLATTYKHTIQFGGALPSFLVEKGYPDIEQYFKYNGCKIGKMSLACTPEGFQKISFDMTGAKETVGTTSFDSTATDLGKSSFSGFMVASITEGGSAIAHVTKVDISIENSLDTGVYVIGGAGLRASIPEGTCKVTGTLEALFENTTLYTKAANSTESSLEIAYMFGTGAGTAANEKLTIKIPELIFKQDTPTISGDKGVMVSLPFEAYYANSAEGTVAQMILLTPQLAV